MLQKGFAGDANERVSTCLRGGYNSELSTSHPKLHGILSMLNCFFSALAMIAIF